LQVDEHARETGCSRRARKTVLQVAESKKSPKRVRRAAGLPDACCCCGCVCCACCPSGDDPTAAAIRAATASKATSAGSGGDPRAFRRIAGLAKAVVAGWGRATAKTSSAESTENDSGPRATDIPLTQS